MPRPPKPSARLKPNPGRLESLRRPPALGVPTHVYTAPARRVRPITSDELGSCDLEARPRVLLTSPQETCRMPPRRPLAARERHLRAYREELLADLRFRKSYGQLK